MTIVVVEDESIPRDGLVQLISKLDASYRVVGQARNGREGKHVVEELTPDLVITDIKMPEMDGLEMIRCLRAEGCAATFVILSGYAEFEFAKQGIVLGVRDYLLKPISPQEIADALRKISGDSQASSLMTQGLESLPAGALLLFFTSLAFPDAQKLISRMLKKMAARPGVLTPRVVDRPDPSSLLYHVTSALSFEELVRCLQEAMHLTKEPMLRAGIACSARPFTKGGELKKLASELHRNLKWSTVLAPLTVIHGGLIAATRCPEPEYPERIESLALGALRSENPSAMQTAVEDFRAFCFSRPYSPARLEEIAFRFFFTIVNLMKEVDYLRFRSMVEIKLLERIEGFRSARELHAIIDDFLSSASSTARAEASGAYSLPVRQTLNYIRTGFRGRISLEGAAGKVGFTPEYLSALFLKETGTNFSVCMTRFRITEAKRLLAAGNARIFEIASEIGFSDAQYFCRVFKKHTGLSPREYSHLHS
jgi:two-component system response regulator YesN